jgi:hypothetical protein
MIGDLINIIHHFFFLIYKKKKKKKKKLKLDKNHKNCLNKSLK